MEFSTNTTPELALNDIQDNWSQEDNAWDALFGTDNSIKMRNQVKNDNKISIILTDMSYQAALTKLKIDLKDF
jgi:hypothetical protein